MVSDTNRFKLDDEEIRMWHIYMNFPIGLDLFSSEGEKFTIFVRKINKKSR